MTRQFFVRILLSLLLLMSQQMAAAHALAHAGAGLLGGSALVHDDASDLSSAFAQDPTCGQCLAFAQLASGLGNTPRAFAPLERLARANLSADAQAACARTVCASQARAPPQA